jgi:hypothetical protein
MKPGTKKKRTMKLSENPVKTSAILERWWRSLLVRGVPLQVILSGRGTSEERKRIGAGVGSFLCLIIVTTRLGAGVGALGAGILGAGTLGVGILGAGTLGAGTLGAGTLGAGTFSCWPVVAVYGLQWGIFCERWNGPLINHPYVKKSDVLFDSVGLRVVDPG